VAGLALIGAAVAVAVLLAAAARLPSLTSFLLVAYLAYVANLGLVTLALSPFREVTRGGLAVAEGLLLAGSVAVWSARGRPSLPFGPARRALRDVLSDPVTVLFLAVVAVLLGYEAVLASTPPNNHDSLAYHLARAAAWAQHGGIYWIANPPEVEMNAYQPLAEQQNLFLMVATGGGVLYAVPQYLAELATLVAVYGSARRLGFAVRASVGSAALLATFSVVALEAVTAQNDLVAASFAAVAVCLLLGSGPLEHALAGASVAFGLGTKLTTGLVVPILVWLAIVRGRRAFVTALAGGIAGLVAIAMWGYVLNLDHSGHVLGAGTADVQDRGSPAYPRSVATAFYLMYGLMDTSVLSYHAIHRLALVGVAVGLGVAAWYLRRGGRRRALAEAAGAALPFLAPLLVIGGAFVVAFVARRWGFPIRGPAGILEPLEQLLNMTYTRIANEDYSAYGPVGIVALIAAAALGVRAYVTRRADMRHLVLALSLPIFLVLISLGSIWVPFLIRYFLLPAVLTAPLLSLLLTSRIVSAAWFAMAAVSIGFTITADQPKPFTSQYGYGHPWEVTAEQALSQNSDNQAAQALVAYDQNVAAHACVGVVLGPNEPTYLLYGPKLDHRVLYLPPGDPLDAAREHVLGYVVFSNNVASPSAEQFGSAGWQIRPLGPFWSLASVPNAGPGTCVA
jgi:hypothetical protein